MRNRFFWFVTVMLTVITVLFTGGTVQRLEKHQSRSGERLYRERESALLADTRDRLEQAGFCHSGVTLNRTVGAEGDRSYIFTIHHAEIDSMDDAQREALERKLEELTRHFEADGEARCSFSYRFLTL